jgi:CRISPR-associated endonuclease/helicase Cas3
MEKEKIEIWAKSKKIYKNESDGSTEERIISLAQHIQDVLSVFAHLNNFLKTDYSSNNPVSAELRQLIEKVIQYHDIGKVLPCFQIKTIKNTIYSPFDVYVNIPHSLLSALMVDCSTLKKEVESILKDQSKAEAYSSYVLSAIAYHHWRENFYDLIEGHTDVFDKLFRLIRNEEKWGQLEGNIQQVYTELQLSDSFKPYINKSWLEGLTNGIRYADYIVPPYQLYRMPQRLQWNDSTLRDWVLMSGFTMLSDHFASYVEGIAEKDITFERIEMKGISFDEIKSKIQEQLGKGIWQLRYIEKCKSDNTILLAPTGMGKTEFAFLWSNGEKFFYTLPMRAAVNQIYNRTKFFFGNDKTGILHSDADIFIYGDGAETESMRVYEMAKQLSSTAIISTGDQFFPYALRPPSYERIFAKFSYSRLIIDEVQAYDPKAAAIVVKFIEHAVQMGGKFLLMTATLPGFIKEEIEQRTGLKQEQILNLFEKDDKLKDFTRHKAKVLIDEYQDNGLSYRQTILQQIIGKAKENNGSRILVVLNTIKQAQKVYEHLTGKNSGEIEIKLFHSRYTQEHRRSIENDLNAFIGNNDASRKDKRAKILVATQVVEASLDLDADYLFTELCPWDSLVQRMGRILRQLRVDTQNESELIEYRYNSREIPENIFVILYDGKKNNLPIYESSQGKVYHNELLRTTLKLLENPGVGVEELKKWNDGKKHDIKNLNKIEPLLLSEKLKSELVEKLFAGLPNKSIYLRDFYNMLQLLDSGFMSDRKSEAQKAFREINDVGVIPEDKSESLISDLEKFDFETKYAYTRFKREIISRYVVNIQRNRVQEHLYESNMIVKRLKIGEIKVDHQSFIKLESWLWGVYHVNLEYSENIGLIGVKEQVMEIM